PGRSAGPAATGAPAAAAAAAHAAAAAAHAAAAAAHAAAAAAHAAAVAAGAASRARILLSAIAAGREEKDSGENKDVFSLQGHGRLSLAIRVPLARPVQNAETCMDARRRVCLAGGGTGVRVTSPFRIRYSASRDTYPGGINRRGCGLGRIQRRDEHW